MTQSITDPHGAPVHCSQDMPCAGPQYPLEGGAAEPAVKNADDPRHLASATRRTPMLVRANASALSRTLHPIQDDKGHVSSPCSTNCKLDHDEDTTHDDIFYPKKVGKTPRASLWLIHAKRSKKSSRRLAGRGAGSSFPAQDNVNGGGNGNENSPRDTADGNPKVIGESGFSGSVNGNGPDGNVNVNSPGANSDANQNGPGGNANSNSNGDGNGNSASNNGDGNGNSNGNGTPGGGTPSGGGTSTSGGSDPSGTGISGSGTPTGGSGSPNGSSSRSGAFNNFAVSTSHTVPNNGKSSPTPTSGGSAPSETGISGGGTPTGGGGDRTGSGSPSTSSSSVSVPFGNFAMSSSRTAPNHGNPSPTPSSGGSSRNDNKPESTSGGEANSNGNASATNQRAGSPTPTRAIVSASHRTGSNKGHESLLKGGWTTITSVSSFTSTGMTTMTYTSGSSVLTTTMSTTTTGVTTISIATDIPEQTPRHHSNAGTIAGALGSVFGLLLILSLFLCYCLKRQKQRKVGFLYLTPGPDTNFTDRFRVNTSPKTKSKLAKRNMSSIHISSPVYIGQNVLAPGNSACEPVSRNIEVRVTKEVRSRSNMSLLQNKPGPPSGNLPYESVTDTGVSEPDLIWFPTDTQTIEDPFDDRFQVQPSSTR